MSYILLAKLHLITILPAFLLGTFLLIRRKGTPNHRLLGKIYMVLMLITAVITLLMPAAVGPRVFNHFGFIHLLSILVFYSVPTAYISIKNNDIQRHRSAMTGLYVGGILVAGALAFMPGRMLHDWLF